MKSKLATMAYLSRLAGDVSKCNVSTPPTPQEIKRLFFPSSPKRIQLSRRKGFNLQAESRKLNGLPAVNCARPSKWGNPFKVGDGFPYGHSRPLETVKEAVDVFGSYLRNGLLGIRKADVRRELRGKNLACWCKPGKPCHCDVLLRIANP